MNSKAINAQLFYKDSTNIIYSMSQNNVDRCFLNIPVSQYTNFIMFIKLKKVKILTFFLNKYVDFFYVVW